MAQFNSLKQGIDSLKETPQQDLKTRFNKWLKGQSTGNNPEKWNKEIGEIEKLLPFKDQEEHNKWLQLGSTFTDPSEYQTFTHGIIDRGGKPRNIVAEARKANLDVPSYLQQLASKGMTREEMRNHLLKNKEYRKLADESVDYSNYNNPTFEGYVDEDTLDYIYSRR